MVLFADPAAAAEVALGPLNVYSGEYSKRVASHCRSLLSQMPPRKLKGGRIRDPHARAAPEGGAALAIGVDEDGTVRIELYA